ncbi:hypothetical protein JZO67_004672 [Enterococcus sp. 665A]|uniref:Uncharacterized protein n=1 Tax=Candidatus Enterococcus ferrettii TaxID=2815324 RepID=A0ABV0EVK8_9ENTE
MREERSSYTSQNRRIPNSPQNRLVRNPRKANEQDRRREQKRQRPDRVYANNETVRQRRVQAHSNEITRPFYSKERVPN